MFYTVYKVTNRINGKFYVGTHKTSNLNDQYMGSGRYLNRAINKHGLENFTKEILHIFDNAKEMYDKEAEIVNEDFLVEENTYNLKIGGYGGFDYINDTITTETRQKHGRIGGKKGGKIIKEKRLSDPEFNKKYSESMSKGLKEAYRKGTKVAPYSFSGKTHTKETKRKMSESSKGQGTGSSNSQYGKVWIQNNIDTSKPVPKEELDEYLNNGWVKGRKIKF